VQNTALGALVAGSSINLEIDQIARYVERMIGVERQLSSELNGSAKNYSHK
jgi:riboflavin synthase